jgi:hypothetical protein
MEATGFVALPLQKIAILPASPIRSQIVGAENVD